LYLSRRLKRNERLINLEENILGKNLRRLRLAQGLSLQDLGDILGVTSSAVSSWELGHKKPRHDTIKKLASYLGVSVDYLIGRSTLQDEKQKREIVSQLANEIYERYLRVPDSKKEMVKEEILKYMNYLQFQAEVEEEKTRRLQTEATHSDNSNEK